MRHLIVASRATLERYRRLAQRESLSAHRWRMARRWSAASAVDFALAAACFFVGWRWPGLVMLAAALFAQYAQWRWARAARRAGTAEQAWNWLEGR